jgi:tetratricopeptide (TPR) repeat protein
VHAERGDARGAARTAMALCHAHADVCDEARSASWLRRARELLAGLPESPEHGLLAWFEARLSGHRGELDEHERMAHRALAIARRSADRNVEALALLEVAHVAGAKGCGGEAMDALERATALALGGEIGVMEAGIVYCNAILSSRARGEWRRAEEWCESANRWVERTQVAYFPGLCRVHRAEVLRIRGALREAEEECLAAVRLLERGIPRWVALALAELGEIRRRRGDRAGAMEAFRRALELGCLPLAAALVMRHEGEYARCWRWRRTSSTRSRSPKRTSIGSSVQSEEGKVGATSFLACRRLPRRSPEKEYK